MKKTSKTARRRGNTRQVHRDNPPSKNKSRRNNYARYPSSPREHKATTMAEKCQSSFGKTIFGGGVRSKIKGSRVTTNPRNQASIGAKKTAILKLF